MKKRGETQEGLHPSRGGDRPHEYELPYGGDQGVNFVGMGYYEKDEIEPSMEYHRTEGDTDNALLQPAQGRLFDPDKIEGANRAKLGRKRFEVDDPYDEGSQAEGAQLRDKALQNSRIPSKDLQSRKGWTMETEVHTVESIGQGWHGMYQGPATESKADKITVLDNLDSQQATNTFVHEAGHRKHLGQIGAFDPLVNHPRGLTGPDPLMEGVADAYADRYGGPDDPQVRRMSRDIESGEPKFGSYAETGYSTDEMSAVDRDWLSTDRALYAAVRGHASETGEQAHYTPTNVQGSSGADATYNPTVDATLHHLLTTSPHAQQAVTDTGLEHIGQQAVRRHQDRMLLHRGQEVQGALFDVENMQHNQFGEKPRTVADVYGTLGVHERQSASRGFGGDMSRRD